MVTVRRTLLLLIAILFYAVSAWAQFDFPNAPTANQIVTGPSGQGFKWDGTKWVAQFGAGAGAYVPLAGGTMTGPLILNANATNPLGAVPLQQVNSLIAASGPWLPVNNPTYTGTMTGPNEVNTGGPNSLTWNEPGGLGLETTFGPGYGNTSVSSFLIGQGASYGNGTYPNVWVRGGTAADGPTDVSSIQMTGAATVITGNTGLSAGQNFTPTMLFTISPVAYPLNNFMGDKAIPAGVTSWLPLNIGTGSLFIGGKNQFQQNGTWTPVQGCSTTNPTIGSGYAAGWWATVGNILFYVGYGGWGTSTGGAGNATINGLPYAAIDPTNGGGFRNEIVISNASGSNAGSNRLLGTVWGGNNYIAIHETNIGGIGYLIPSPCANAWPNTGSQYWVNGWYKYQ